MSKTSTASRHEGAERAIRSAEAAERYLSQLGEREREYARDLRAFWRREGLDIKASEPSPARRISRVERLARALLAEVGPRSRLGRELLLLADQIKRRDPASVEFRRRLATAPIDERFALLLAVRAFTLFRDQGGYPRTVSGRLAAVIAAAEGIAKPRARAKQRSIREDPADLTIRAWEASMSRAGRTVLRWRRDEVSDY